MRDEREVKYQGFRKPLIPKGLLSFLSHHNCDAVVVITKDCLAKAG
ncbi:MAG: hypothetical protein AAB110_02355 [Candidatus Desantisbacteria bacterium]